MKKCLACHRTYEDSQKVCIRDKVPLVSESALNSDGKVPPQSLTNFFKKLFSGRGKPKNVLMILIPTLFWTSTVFAETYSKDGVTFSIDTPSGFEARSLPRADVAYLVVGTEQPFITSVSVRVATDPKRAALLKNPGMKAAYLVGQGEQSLETGTVQVDWLPAFYAVTVSKEFMQRQQRDLFQVEKKIQLAREDEVFTLSFAATGWTVHEASENFEALRSTFNAMLLSFDIQ